MAVAGAHFYSEEETVASLILVDKDIPVKMKVRYRQTLGVTYSLV